MSIKKILVSLIAGAVMTTVFALSAMAANETDPMEINANTEINGVNIIATDGPAIAIAENANVTLTIVGNNYVKGATGCAGIYVPESSTLTIIGDGTLTAVGGDSVSFKYKDVYNDNSSQALNLYYVYSAGAGIGGNGASYARNKNYDNFWGVAGNEGVVYKSGQYYYLIKNDASFGTIVINMDDDGTINATGGAAAERAINSQGSGAGIGSGGTEDDAHYNQETDENDPLCGSIVISNGKVVANGGMGGNSTSTNSGAGIGAGCCGGGGVGNAISITISGGDIVANGNGDSAAIGGGAHVEAGIIKISGGNIIAVSGVETTESGNGAGIGAGNMASDGMVTINGNAVVSATANGNAAGIGAGESMNSSNSQHNTNVLFGGTADITFKGGNTTFFKIEEGSNPVLKANGAVCAIVDSNDTVIGFATSFDEAVSVIDEFDDVDTIRLINDIEVDKTIVIKNDIIIDGDGYTLKSADITETETHGAAVTPVMVDGAEVTFKNITIQGGHAYNNDPYQPTASHGVAATALKAKDATVIIKDSELRGGDSGAEFTMSAGSSIDAVNSKIIVEDSVLATGRLTRANVVGVANIYLDADSTVSLTNVTLDTAYSRYASDNVIASKVAGNGNTTDYTGDVALDGEIKVIGTKLSNINIVPGENLTFKGNIDASYISDTLTIKYVKKDIANNKDTDEEADLYDIVIEGDKQFINRLTTVDLTFMLTSTTAVKPVYEIIPVAPITVTEDADFPERYMFSFDGVTQPDETAKSVVIGQVKITGYGAYVFAVDANAETNLANATKTNDSIVENFIPGGDVTKGEGVLVIDATIDAEITVPTRELNVVIDFPNAVKKNAAEYQDMTVTVSGGDLKEAVVIKLGDNAQEVAITTEYEKQNAKYTVDVTAENKYTVTVEDILTVNTTYTVTVEGAGYRTARYSVTMNCDESKTLNFWNNVKDNAVEVEEKKDSSKKNVTFLAGDIVKDSVINIYDLSAVVSYFGEIDLSETNNKTYAKYDLNRDGKIDSKDVAYVLVSWGN